MVFLKKIILKITILNNVLTGKYSKSIKKRLLLKRNSF